MNKSSAASAYKQAIFESAPPIKIIHLMYEGALRLLGTARSLDPEKEHREFGDSLTRAEAIVAELRLALDHEHDPALAEQLESLYRFAEHEIREAFLQQSVEPIEGARNVLQTLLDGWRRVEVDLDARSA